ncbi:MAG TPA: DUF3565 domain-containing protein [Polyangiaceae bacterium]
MFGVSARAAVGFHQDAAGDWVATLACGHTLHVRHRPPFQLRPWVTTEAGRHEKLGASFDCSFCEMPEIPTGARVYEQSREFDETSTPAALLASHRLRPGVWGRIVVLEGLLRYELLEGKVGVWILRPGVVGPIAPGLAHRVSPCGRVRFQLEFLALGPDESSKDPD